MALQELFSTFYGQISLFTILFVIVMAVFFISYFSNRIAEDERKAAKQRREQSAKA
ncbi:MAG: DUF3149 domain-containing protein [Azoarcus sp.]|jgi:Na+-transporting methylmalonyl-CoA/oxaloacetate decarboxylase gamma subunit|nr:DUF3149 domain-containing protein [Azoarcus sp.]